MSLINHLTPEYYQVLRMGVQRGDGLFAAYDIAILNGNGQQLDILNLDAGFTPVERDALIAIFQRDQAQFEANTGLTEWVEEP